MAKISSNQYNPATEDRIEYIIAPPDPEREKRRQYVENMFKADGEKPRRRRRGK